MKYQLYTENKNLGTLKTVIASHFEGATLKTGNEGLWRGVWEKSVEVEILTDTDETEKVQALVNDIKYLNSQESVMVVITKCNTPIFL